MELFEEAGFDPDGFEFSVVVRNDPIWIDTCAMIADHFSKVGMTMTLIPVTAAEASAIKIDQLHEWAYFSYEDAATASMGLHSDFLTGAYQNYAIFDNAEYNEMLREYDTSFDPDRQIELLSDLNLLLMREMAEQPTPGYSYFRYAWPWVMNYEGEGTTRYYSSFELEEIIWIDQDMKKEMGY